MTSWIIAILAAVLLGIASNIVYDLLKYGVMRLPRILQVRRALPAVARRYDATQDGLYPFVTWSGARPLLPQRLRSSFIGPVGRPHLFDVPEWHSLVAQFRSEGEAGRTAYLVRVGVDHDEHDQAHSLRVTVAESDYAQCLATMQTANKFLWLGQHLEAAVCAGLDTLLQTVPPTSLTASVAVISPKNRFLVMRRSLSVRTFRAQWTIGVNEGMKYNDEPGAPEDFFSLIRRAVSEELGLTPSDYGNIVVSWFGWSQPAANFLIVAMVRVNLSETEVERRRGQCHSVYEHDMVAWLPLSPKSIGSVITSGRCPDGSTRWSYLAPLVAGELWRCQELAHGRSSGDH